MVEDAAQNKASRLQGFPSLKVRGSLEALKP
jgi:hypothetical protein